MNYKALCLSVLMFCVFNNYAQSLDWRKTYNTPNVSAKDVAQKIATDASGNSIIANITTSVLGFKITIAKINSSGVEQWRYATTELRAQIFLNDLQLDATGNIYLAGTAPIDETKGPDMFLLKLNSSGGLVFHNYSGISTNSSNYKDKGKKVLIDASGNAYLFGQVRDSRKMRLVKYSATGTETWSLDIDKTGSGYNDRMIAADLEFHSSGSLLLFGSSYQATGIRELVVYEVSTAGVLNASHFYDPFSPSNPRAKAMAYNPTTQKLALIGDLYQTIGGFGVVILQIDIANWTVDWNKAKQGSFGNNIDVPINIFYDQNNVVAVGILRETYVQSGTQNYDPTFIEKLSATGTQLWEYWYFHTSGVYKYNAWTTDAKIDANGNVYLCGDSYFTFSESFIIKCNNTGTLAWDKRFSSPIVYSESAKAIGLDAAGNTYTTITSAEVGENEDVVVIKNDASLGTQLFKYQYSDLFPGNGNDQAVMSKCDAADNTYVLYNSRGNSTDLNFSLIKYNSLGTVLWHYHFDNSGSYDIAESFIIDPTGFVYITGKTQAAGSSGSEVFLKKLQASNGADVWMRQYSFNATQNASGKDLVFDAAGNIIIMAEAASNGSGKLLQYSPAGVLYNATPLPVNFYADGKLTHNGTDIVVANSTSGNAALETHWYNSTTNTLVTKTFTPGSNHSPVDIKADASGNIYVLVNYRNPSNINKSTVVKYNNTQTQLWSGEINNSGTWDYGVNLLLATNGDVIATGYHNQTGQNDNVDITSLNPSTGIANWNRQVNFENRVDKPKSIVESNGLYLISAISSFYPSVCGITADGGIAFAKMLHSDYSYSSIFLSCINNTSFTVSGHFFYPSFAIDLYIEKYFIPNYWNGSVSSAWGTASNWSDIVPVIADDIYIGNFHPNQPIVNANAVANNATLHIGASLTLAPSSTLNINGDLINEGTIVAEQDAANYSQLLVSGNALGSGIIKAEKYIKSTGFMHLGSPFSTLLSDVGEPGYLLVSENTQKGNFWFWNASSAEWSSVNLNSSFVAGRGYSVFAGTNIYGSFTAQAPGKITLESISTSLFTANYNQGTYYNNGQTSGTTFVGGTSSAATQGWNLLANPYLCNYQWDGQTVNGSSSQAYYIWTGTQYKSYVSGGGVNGATGYIPPFYGFWVQRTGGSYQNFIFDKTRRTISGGSANKTNNLNPKIRLSVAAINNPTITDEMLVEFHPLGNDNFEGDKDALKLKNADNVPMLWSIADENLSINRCRIFETEKHIPLGFSSAKSGDYIVEPNLEETPLDWWVYLEDQLTQNWVNLTDGAYKFSHQPQNNTSRFVLHFYKTNPPVITNGKLQKALVYQKNNQLVVRFSQKLEMANILVTNSLGQEIFSKKRVNTSEELILPINSKTQVLVVRIISANWSENYKVIF